MREPRPRQRLPEGGLEIFEKQKAGLWRTPHLLVAYPADWINPRGKTPTREEILSWGYTILIQPHFDPMLYFWPVDDCVLLAHTPNIESHNSQRLVRAALRDGAQMVTISSVTPMSSHNMTYTQDGGWKKPATEWGYDATSHELIKREMA